MLITGSNVTDLNQCLVCKPVPPPSPLQPPPVANHTYHGHWTRSHHAWENIFLNQKVIAKRRHLDCISHAIDDNNGQFKTVKTSGPTHKHLSDAGKGQFAISLLPCSTTWLWYKILWRIRRRKCVSGGEGTYLVLLSTSFFVVLEDVVPHIILWVDEKLLGLPLLVTAFHPHDEQQHQDWSDPRWRESDRKMRNC